MAANGFDMNDLEISEESFSSLFEEINSYTPKTPLNREPSARAASMPSQGRLMPVHETRTTRSSVPGQPPRTTARPTTGVPPRQRPVQQGNANRQQWQPPSVSITQPGLRSTDYSKQPAPVQKKKDHSFLKFLIGVVLFVVVLRACGIISDDKDTKSQIPEETVAVEEEIVEVSEEETVDLVFDSKYLIKHGPAEQLERLTLRLDSGEFTRTKDGKLAITTKRNALHEKIVQYLSDELPNVSRADYPNFLEITSNDDFTEFEFKVAAATLYQHEENYMKDVLMIAQMNAEMNGNPNEVITIVFKNLNGDVLREKDTKVSG